MDILAVQQRLIDAGYQFHETVYNDGSSDNCYVRIAKSRDPSFFNEHPLGDAGWGRYPRMSAWRMVAEFLDDREHGT